MFILNENAIRSPLPFTDWFQFSVACHDDDLCTGLLDGLVIHRNVSGQEQEAEIVERTPETLSELAICWNYYYIECNRTAAAHAFGVAVCCVSGDDGICMKLNEIITIENKQINDIQRAVHYHRINVHPIESAI